MLPIVELIRLEESHAGTFGILRIQKEVFCVCLEPPDRVNEQNVSSIPAQQYECHKIVSNTYGETFKVMNVPGRESILFHSGNFVEHTKGCILLAQYFGKLKGDRAVLNSGKTFHAFMAIMEKYEKFHLTIHEFY